MDSTQAQLTVRDYGCATCWGHLLQRHEGTETVVECAKYGGEHEGYVTKAFVERRRAESQGEAHEATELLESLGIIDSPHKGKSPNQIISELGF